MRKKHEVNLKTFRGHRTQQEIADVVGIKRPTYTMIENGQRRPSVKVAKKIANVLGFDWTLFYEERIA